MKKNVRRLLSLFTLVCLIVTQTLSASAAAQSSQPRVYGSDRYKTSVAISQKGWSESQYAVIARGDDFADALCAGPLAKKYDAPILLTQPDKISNDVLAELKRLGVKNVFIVGGNGAVSENVENILKSSGIASIERIFGADRYETSVKIAEKLGSVDKMALATGSDFPDALSISAIASSMGMPILLTEKNTLPAKVRSYIVSAGIAESYVIGGTGVISDSVKNALPNAIRLGGKDRYETNVAVMNQFVDKLNFNKIYVAVGDGKDGDGFADALSGAALAAKDSSPLILVYKVLPKVTADFLKPKVFAQSQVYALGGEAVVPSTILDDIAFYISQGLNGKILSQAGVYGPQEGTETVDDNVIITVRDVTLQNTIIEGDLIITESVGDGDVTLKNVTVNGTTTIRGGGPNSIVMYNFKGKTVVVDVPDGRSVRLVAQGDTSVESLNMNSDGKAGRVRAYRQWFY
jgi:putative cell wall-binding protein